MFPCKQEDLVPVILGPAGAIPDKPYLFRCAVPDTIVVAGIGPDCFIQGFGDRGVVVVIGDERLNLWCQQPPRGVACCLVFRLRCFQQLSRFLLFGG
jgi:hypothetical protein